MTADVFLFPQLRRSGHARHIIVIGSAMKTERLRQTYWRQRKAAIARKMRQAGFDELQIGDAVEAFVFLVGVQADLLSRRAEAEARALAEAPRLRRAEVRQARRARCGDVTPWRPPVARDEAFRLTRWRRLAPPTLGSFSGLGGSPRVLRSAVIERFLRF